MHELEDMNRMGHHELRKPLLRNYESKITETEVQDNYKKTIEIYQSN